MSQIIPALTEAAWRDKHEEIAKIAPAIDRSAFVFSYPRTAFEQDYGHDYQRPGLFAHSFRDATARFRAEVDDLRDRRFELRNANFDTGEVSRYGDYSLTDDTYAELVERLSTRQFRNAPITLTRHIVAFYGDAPQPSTEDRRHRKRWTKVERALKDLREQSNRKAAAGVE